jgi:hypothetical protein
VVFCGVIINIIVLERSSPYEGLNIEFLNVDVDKKSAGLILNIAFGKGTFRN